MKTDTPAKEAKSEEKEGYSAAEPADDNIDKIRDIIFGGQMRDYDRRFSRLEERLIKDSADLRSETTRRLEDLEQFVRSELEVLTKRLSGDSNSHTESIHKLSDAMRETAQSFERKISEFDENHNRAESDLRQQLLNLSKNFSEDLQRVQQESSAKLERESAELRDDKVDRAALAELFGEFAMRLNGDFRLPKAD